MAEPPKRPRRRPGRRSGKSRLGLYCAVAVILLLGAYAAVVVYAQPHVSGDRLRFDTLVALAKQRRIIDARILNQDAIVVGRYRTDRGATRPYNAVYLKTAANQGSLIDLLVKRGVPLTIDQQTAKQLAVPATFLLPSLIIVVIFVYLLLSYREGTGLFGIRSGARRISAEEADVDFGDVAGQDAAITELRELVQFLKEPERFAQLGALIPRGVLLYGPPGCGKTLVARALAGEAGASFYSISGSDFVELYVGVGAARVRDLFKEARENAPSIVFVDELDSVGRRRGGAAAVSSQGEQEQALNQILAEMDGFSPTEGIIVVGATNRADVLDPALLRPGRFDRTVGLERPDELGRLAILKVHAARRRLAPGVDLRAIARKALGMTGADLAQVINEAALLAARAGKPAVSQAELDEALRRTLEAPERQRRLSLRDQSVGRRQSPGQERITFADVAGVDDALAELVEVKDYLAEPERFAALGARAPRGILLAGPPGCGKTLLAKAVAGEANAAFITATATEFVEVFVGQGAARVRDLFAEARLVAPAIVFIDELDAIGARRSVDTSEGNREREQTLNQILVELDGFEEHAGLMVIAATNRIDILDPALIRPGRFDRQVTVELPDRAGRQAILAVHAKDKRLADDVDLAGVARVTRGFSGADLANVLNEATLLTARARDAQVSAAAIEEAVERVLLGIASHRHILSDAERMIVAYHEAGHALVGRALPGIAIPHKITITPRGRTLGYVWNVDEDNRTIHSRSALTNRMAMMLGGRVAEELVFGDPSSGAGEDLSGVNALAQRMVCELGMSPALGHLTFELDHDGARRYSEDEARLIGIEIRRLTDEAHDRARRLLAGSRDVLDRVAHALVEQETLTASELEHLAERSPTLSS